jgi:formylglycine-generating enzyme required for sulfatase activity
MRAVSDKEPATTLSGDAGGNILPGSNKRIVWDAGADWNGQFSSSVRVQVTVTDVSSGMAAIPDGTFQMGDGFSEGNTSERPVHSVSVSAFCIDRLEVTKAMWDEVRAWGAGHGYTDLPAGSGKAANHPVWAVNWYAAVKWCNARSEKEGFTPCYTYNSATYKLGEYNNIACNWTANGYRLPTEAEWEKAARGGVEGQRFPWGAVVNHDYANYRANHTTYPAYDTSPYTVDTFYPPYATGDHPFTSPIGTFGANGYGLYDVSGNVFEWCWDRYGSTYYNGLPSSNPRGPDSGTDRVVRGGSWYAIAFGLRNSFRNFFAPSFTGVQPAVGFRAARSVP